MSRMAWEGKWRWKRKWTYTHKIESAELRRGSWGSEWRRSSDGIIVVSPEMKVCLPKRLERYDAMPMMMASFTSLVAGAWKFHRRLFPRATNWAIIWCELEGSETRRRIQMQNWICSWKSAEIRRRERVANRLRRRKLQARSRVPCETDEFTRNWSRRSE